MLYTAKTMPAPAKARSCRLVTLGCKVNQYDTQWVKEMLESHGWHEAGEGEPTELCVVNTCTVTHEADAQARQLIRQLARSNPGARIVVMGCYASRDPQGLTHLPEVSKVLPDRAMLLAELAELGVAKIQAGIRRFDNHQRAFVKVQDGCLLSCTFCIIPKVRPAFRSRPLAEIVAEVRALLETQTREIVLTGIHLGHYGLDLSRGKPRSSWTRLWHLIEALDELPGKFRIRLSSLEAAEARDDLLRAAANSPRVVPHFHLCLQSGSDRILAAMRRRYRVASFLRRCDEVRRRFDAPAITTDVIVGFPGETEEDFAATLRAARAAGFAKMHIFPFSPRKGTPAAEFPHQVAPPVLAERKARLAELDAELTAAYNRTLVGRRLEVLVEGTCSVPAETTHGLEGPAGATPTNGQALGPATTWLAGTACRGMKVALPGQPHEIRRLLAVRILRTAAGRLMGEREINGEAAGKPFRHDHSRLELPMLAR